MENASANANRGQSSETSSIIVSFRNNRSFPRLNVRFMCHHLICSILSNNVETQPR